MDNQNKNYQPQIPVAPPAINPPPPINNQSQPIEVKNGNVPWPLWLTVIGSMIAPISAYFIILLNLKKTKSKDVLKFAIWGGLISFIVTVLPVIILFLKYGNDISHNRSGINIYTQAFGIIVAYWQHKKFVEPWEKQTGQKSKFSANIISWSLLGIFVNFAIILLTTILCIRFIFPTVTPSGGSILIKSPQQAFGNIITSNPVFSQVKNQLVPQGQVAKKNNSIITGLVSVKKDLTPQNIANQTTISKKRTSISINGQTLPIATMSAQLFDLKIGQTTYVDNKNNSAALDLIANGSLGNLKFDDSDQDAFHLSLTKVDSQNSYLRIDMSDLLLIFIHTLMNGPSQNHIINFNTDSIWPYLGQYLHIPKVVEDKIYTNPTLDSQNQKIQTDIRNNVNNIYNRTLGSPLSYITIIDTKNEQISSVSAVTFTANLNSKKFADVIESYIRGMEKIITDNQSGLTSLCNATYQVQIDQQKCLSDMTPKTSAEVDHATNSFRAIALAIKADNIKASINLKDFNVIKFLANINFTNTETSTGWSVSLPFQTLTINIDTQDMGVSNNIAVTTPPNPVEILATNLTSANNSSISLGATNSVQNVLYTENRQQFLATAYNTPGTNTQVCSGKVNSQYCLTVPDLWSVFDNKNATDQTLTLTRKNTDPNDSSITNITIIQKLDPGFISGCDFPDNKTASVSMPFIGSKDILTKDNIALRIGDSKPDPMFSFHIDYVCTKNTDHYIMTTSYGTISMETGKFSFNDLVSEVAPILSSLKASNNTMLNQPLPTLFITQAPVYLADPAPQILNNSAGHYVQLYGARLGDDQNCIVDSSYINDTYGLGNNGFAVVADKKSICIFKNSCAICNNSKIGTSNSDLSACKKQACNP